MLRSVLALSALLLTACDSGTEAPPQAVPLVHGTYLASWTVNEDGPGDNRRTRSEYVLSVRITEAGGVLSQFPGNAGDVTITRELIDTNTGNTTNRLSRSADVRLVTGALDTQGRTFDLQIRGEGGDYVFEATMAGSLGTTYAQLRGPMVGRLYNADNPDEPTTTFPIDQTVTFNQQ
ncbi:MAG: hypothetical protein AAFQ43_13800 [Bacteroidota bacterium]